ncbi:MAG: hypothetical protein WC683_08000 [bacterium]
MALYHGRHGLVYMSTTGTGNATSITSLTTWSLDMSRDTVEVTAFGDTNKVYVAGLKDIKGSFEGFWDDTNDNIYDGSDSADGVKLYLYPSSDAITKYWYGPAWLDMSVETGVGDAVKISANFSANGAWGQK